MDLTRINGLGLTAVMKILSEIGSDLSHFATVKHFCSWLSLCPGTKISGGKVLSAKTKRSAPFYRRLCSRMDKPRAITATAHKLARLIYTMLTKGEEYTDQGQEHYEERYRQRVLWHLNQRAAKMGLKLVPCEQSA